MFLFHDIPYARSLGIAYTFEMSATRECGMFGDGLEVGGDSGIAHPQWLD
jgi:hypothetical protein